MFLLCLYKVFLAAIMNLFHGVDSESSTSFKSQCFVYFLPEWFSELTQVSLATTAPCLGLKNVFGS